MPGSRSRPPTLPIRLAPRCSATLCAAPGSWPEVLGIEADADAISSDGTTTCFAASAQTINATCRARPQSVATLTGRIGYAMSPADELQNIAPIGLLPIRSATLIYGKAGVARANSQIDMAINNDLAGFAGPDITSNSTNTTFWGWTVGLGIEQVVGRMVAEGRIRLYRLPEPQRR